MPRRALRKKTDASNLSEYLCRLTDLPRPLDVTAWFGRSGDLVVEVGTGKGLFLQNAAVARPDCLFLGIEIAHKYAEFAATRMRQRQLRNVRIVSGHALSVLAGLLPNGSVWEVHVYFPDPWWKHRHRRRRVMNEAFVQNVERVLRPGGRLHFWTDVAEYFQESVELIGCQTILDGPFTVPEEPAWHDMDFRTHFERRVRTNELPVFRAEFAKRSIEFQYDA